MSTTPETTDSPGSACTGELAGQPPAVELTPLGGPPPWAEERGEWWGYRISVEGCPEVDYWMESPEWEQDIDGGGLARQDERLGDGRDPEEVECPHIDDYWDELETAVVDEITRAGERPYHPLYG